MIIADGKISKKKKKPRTEDQTLFTYFVSRRRVCGLVLLRVLAWPTAGEYNKKIKKTTNSVKSAYVNKRKRNKIRERHDDNVENRKYRFRSPDTRR